MYAACDKACARARSAAQGIAAQRSAAQHSAAQRSAAQRCAALRSAAQRSAAQRSAALRRGFALTSRPLIEIDARARPRWCALLRSRSHYERARQILNLFGLRRQKQAGAVRLKNPSF